MEARQKENHKKYPELSTTVGDFHHVVLLNHSTTPCHIMEIPAVEASFSVPALGLCEAV